MPTVNTHEAKTKLSAIINEVVAGEEYVIARNGKPMVKLVPVDELKPRVPGRFVGTVKMLDGFFDPMTDEELDLIENGHENDPLRDTKG